MQTGDGPLARELVLVGGGHSHVIFLRMLGMHPIPGVKVTLVSPDYRTPYSGMLPGMVAGHYTEDEVHIDLVPLCRFAGADFLRASATGIDVVNRQVYLQDRPAVNYDVLSIDIGSTPSIQLSGSQDVTPVKPISSFLSRWNEFLDRLEEEDIGDIGFVGGGAGGVELCLAVQHRLRDRELRFHQFTDSQTLLPTYPPSVRIRIERHFHQKGIEIHRGFHATSFVGRSLHSSDERQVPLDEVFWVTHASAQAWPADSGLAVDPEGFISTDDTLQSTSHPGIFAVGDCASMVNHPRPKAGVFAVRQGKPLFQNIRASLLGKNLHAYRPQADYLSLVSTGPRHAVASRNGQSLEGAWVWHWKDRIDRKFMDRFSNLPRMHRQPANSLLAEFDEQMHCGGCGSKVSADLLSEVLTELMGSEAPSDDAARVRVPEGSLLLQTVDHFRSFIGDPYRQARIAVCHALSDIYACGGEGISVQATLTLPFGKPGVTRSLLRQLMMGTLDQLQQEQVTLIGGHTSEGAELSIGFTANGAVVEGEMWPKQGLRSGDVLILTKPLGTGTILAADMQYRARGDWVEAAVEMMLTSNRAAASVLSNFSVSACTDVTGFGFANHLAEMLGRDQGAVIHQDDVPILPGAAVCIGELGIRSTLHEANRASAAVSGHEILFDPQTSGGLLFGLQAGEADTCVNALRAAGYVNAAVVGTVTGSTGIQVE